MKARSNWWLAFFSVPFAATASLTGQNVLSVGSDFIEAYDWLLGSYGCRLSPPREAGDREGVDWIEPVSGSIGFYRVSDQVLQRYDVMNAMRFKEGAQKR